MADEKKDIRIDVEHLDFDVTYRPNQVALEVHDKDDAFTYRWVGNDPRAIASRQRMGYEVVPKTDKAHTVSGDSPDGRIMAGGQLVLMRRKREITEAHEAHLRKRAEAARIGPRESFKTKAARANVESIDESEETVTRSIKG